MTGMPPGSGVPWAPEGLPVDPVRAPEWGYVVVEEIVDGVALLHRWPWPVVDPLGRLLWPNGAEQRADSATVPVVVLTAQLYEPNGLRRRPRCGDAFAVPDGGRRLWRGGRPVRDLRELLGDAVYDISADAREAVKIAYQSSLGAVQAVGTADPSARDSVAAMLERRSEQGLPLLAIAAPSVNGRGSRR